MKNAKQTFKDGYGTFPYIIDRLPHGMYKQIPISFTSPDLGKNELGVSFPIKKEQTVINDEDLIVIHKDALVQLTKRTKEKAEKVELIKKRMCLVLGSKKGIYFEPNDKIIESNSIPKGGYLLGERNETVTQGKCHYQHGQESNFSTIDNDLLRYHIDDQKLQ